MVGDRRGHGDKGSDCEDKELSIGIRVTVIDGDGLEMKHLPRSRK